jgi:hypothetical protein
MKEDKENKEKKGIPSNRLFAPETETLEWRIDTEVLESPGPLGMGILNMTPTCSLRGDPWGGSDDARSLPTPSARPSTVESARTTGIPNSSVLPLSPAERDVCLNSFEERGYSKGGGMPIRDAIDLYHKVSTGHVNFSKVWMLVDPQSCCRIDRTSFCAFIALVHSIVEQGDDVRLPSRPLSEEEISFLALEEEQHRVELDPVNVNADWSSHSRHAGDDDFIDVPLSRPGEQDVRMVPSADGWDGTAVPRKTSSIRSLAQSLLKLSIRKSKKTAGV